MIGTEDGCILSCNKAKGQGDRISATMDGKLMPHPYRLLYGHQAAIDMPFMVIEL